MYLIAGLGNPGKDYDKTRHNIGFDVIDEIASKCGNPSFGKEHKALVAKTVVGGQKCLLVKPQTFMNLSGESIRAITDYYKIDALSELIVISDDIDLPVGGLRIRAKGSAGGHNGLKNIILNLGTDGFMRVRVGVGDSERGRDELIEHVLGRFLADDRILADKAIRDAAAAVETIITEGIQPAMNKYNLKKKKKEEEGD